MPSRIARDDPAFTGGNDMRSFGRKTRIFLVCLLLAASPIESIRADNAIPGTFSVFYGGQTWPIQLHRLDGGEYVSVDDLRDAIGGSLERGTSGLDVTYRYGGSRFQFEDAIPFFSFDDRPYQLVNPPAVVANDFLIPLQFVTEYIPYFFPDLFLFESESGTLRDRRFYAFIKGTTESTSEDETVVFLFASSPPRFETDTSRPGTLLLNLFETRCSPLLADSIVASGFIDSTRISESGRSTQLLFFLKPSVQRYRVAEIKAPPGISIAFSGNGPDEKDAPSGDQDLVSGIIDPREFMIRRIAIDPGHGGKDPGAIGGNGLREKDVNLDVAREVASLLDERTDLEVILTRKDDTYISLSDRTSLANRRDADLFVSIHCNASKKRKVKGFEAYFLSVAKTDEERAVALRENLSVRFEKPSIDSSSIDELEFIFWDLAQNEHLRESSEWAEIMCDEFRDGSRKVRGEVRQAGFYVLNGAYMPAILLEIGYVSNPEEEKLLGDSSYQKVVAGEIFEGIQSYIERYNLKVGG